MERSAALKAWLDGPTLAATLWALEVLVIALVNADVGGWPVLADLADDLARWGLVYVAFGAVAGALATRLGAVGALAPWLVALVVADPGVAPRPVYVGVIAIAAALAWAARRVPDRGRLILLGGFGVTLVGVGVGVGVGALAGHEAPVHGVRGDRPDIVLIVVDTLRRDHVGAYGGDVATPSIDGLAAEGLRFTNAWSTSSWTLPSHASLFTGLLPGDHGAVESHPRLDGGHRTLAESLAGDGYRTVGLSANAWVSAGTGLDRGFQRFAFLGDRGIADQLLLALVFDRPDDLGGQAIADAAVAELADAAAAGEPLFLFANLLEAHEPLGTLPGFDPAPGRAWLRDMPRSWCTCADGVVVGDFTCRDGLFRASEARVHAVHERYDAGVTYDDARIGAILGALRASGRLDRTLVIVTSDHGEHLGADGRLGHMVWLDQELVDVPLIVRFPGRFAAGTVDAAPIDLTAVAPLVLAIADGRPVPTRSAVARAEVHAHRDATRTRLGVLYACDFEPMVVERRALAAGGRPLWWEGAAGPTRGVVQIEASTRQALDALGYVE